MRDRKLLMIPGPIDFTGEVLQAMGVQTASHTAPSFIEIFGEALARLRDVFLCPSGRPFVLAGSGTLAMEAAAANLIEPGDNALVVNTGYFSDRFGAILERYEAAVVHVRTTAPGEVPPLEEIEKVLRGGKFKLMTVTHVDTSTAVVADVKRIAALARQYDCLLVVDGVCSVAGEELRQEEWGIDVALTASQKAMGVPPGLALLVAGTRAMQAFGRRKQPVRNYFADWSQWLPIMEAYEARKPSYFATPAVNLVAALDISLGQILKEGMEARWARHRRNSDAFKAAVAAMGLKQVPTDARLAAHTLTAPYFPDGIDASLIPRIQELGVVVAGGLHPAIRARYFRVGHMGAVDAPEILATVGAIERALIQCGYGKLKPGAGLQAAQEVLQKD